MYKSKLNLFLDRSSIKKYFFSYGKRVIFDPENMFFLGQYINSISKNQIGCAMYVDSWVTEPFLFTENFTILPQKVYDLTDSDSALKIEKNHQIF